MTPDMELVKRNALLRAWRAYGVPVEGGWVVSVAASPVRVVYRLVLQCTVCRQAERWADCGFDIYTRLFDPAAVEEGRVYTVRENGCHHLDSLVEAPPPQEVMAIFDLEMLAGE